MIFDFWFLLIVPLHGSQLANGKIIATTKVKAIMAKLQAATVSNRIVKKRKRKDIEPSDPQGTAASDNDATVQETSTITTIPTKEHDGGSKPRRTPKSQSPSKALSEFILLLGASDRDSTLACLFPNPRKDPPSIEPRVHILLHPEASGYDI